MTPFGTRQDLREAIAVLILAIDDLQLERGGNYLSITNNPRLSEKAEEVLDRAISHIKNRLMFGTFDE